MPDHLCVLVHGLWGNPNHLSYLNTSLREQFSEDKLHILVTKRNSGNFTYDGIELGGERVAHEIEQEIEELKQKGHDIKRISVIGYSLGGLMSRYAIGLLYHKGLFDKIEPVNFTTFATPHLGVRSPLKGLRNQIVNVLGARTLSMSGRQIFLIDEFRDTGRPLLAVLADPDSIFIEALLAFKHRTLYANVVNDRSVPYYTASFSPIDPFVDPDALDITYLNDYEPVILDPAYPVSKKMPLIKNSASLSERTRAMFGNIPTVAFMMLLVPIGSTAFLVNAAIQSFRSTQRIRLHEEGKAGIDVKGYRVPLLGTIRREMGDMLERVGTAQEHDYLSTTDAHASSPRSSRKQSHSSRQADSPDSDSDVDSIQESKNDIKSWADFPTLALTPDQFKMIENLDNVGWEKFPVFIHKHRHSHAAIIYRRQGAAFEEGHVVTRHWLSRFEI
ncbi:lipid particle protein [Lophiostoma macrostomum CBS 122681]|uniref:Lipid particle protein n=1 Tax=Lophiostoma macrostomum CBS 122681 TaxID=1314788 RepID=A0A6A6SL40_9PLEO|nr:lipid particle protein [Lophiostoma macrostomum CBS 122681]